MSRIASTAADAPGASDPAPGGDPPAQDGWRTGGLPALRAELDRIDNTVHDLLMQRAKIVEYVARSGKPAAFRPGREASIIRRLLGRHQGSLPPVALVRIWRELLAGTTTMQGGFSLAVCDGEPGAGLTQLTREHFGALTPLRSYGSASQALADVMQGTAAAAVLPYPSEASTWWVTLLHEEPRLHVIARLPFWRPRPEGSPSVQALVVASTPADASEDDISLLGFECDSDVSRARLSSELSAAGLTPQTMVVHRPSGAPVSNVLIEIAGRLSDDDRRLRSLGPAARRPIVLGLYAVPVSGAPQ